MTDGKKRESALRRFIRRAADLTAAALLTAALCSCTIEGSRRGGATQLVYKPSKRAQTAADPAERGHTPAVETVEGPLFVEIEGAFLMVLENNPALAVERLGPQIQSTFEDEAAAEFDPVLGATAETRRQRVERFSRASTGTESSVSTTNEGGLSVGQSLPTGTEVEFEATTDQTTSSLSDTRLTSTRVGLSVTQKLLRGFGREVNLASLRQARLDTLASEYELRGFVEALIANVEKTYWDYALAERQIEIVNESLQLAEQQRSETQERINIGTLPGIELAAAQAEVALRHEALINARSNLASTRLRLLQLLNPPGPNMWDREVVLTEVPSEPDGAPDEVADHVALAMKMRPELNQARLAVQRNDLELVQTRNGLLPRMDLFITLGTTGYAETFSPSLREIDGQNYDVSAGLAFEYPFSNRAAHARHDRALLDQRQWAEALVNLTRLVELDVRSAHIEVKRTAEQVVATAARRRLQEETLRGEMEKFRVGKSTSFLVGQVQRDLVVSQIDEVRTLVNYRKALVDLFRLDGSLLVRRGIVAPGDEMRREQAAAVE